VNFDDDVTYNRIIRFYEYPNRETPVNHNPIERKLTPSYFFRKERPEKAFMAKKELKEEVVWKRV
jgi:hypothetical protein